MTITLQIDRPEELAWLMAALRQTGNAGLADLKSRIVMNDHDAVRDLLARLAKKSNVKAPVG